MFMNTVGTDTEEFLIVLLMPYSPFPPALSRPSRLSSFCPH